MKGAYWQIRNEQQRKNLIKEIESMPFGDFGYQVQIKTGAATNKQKGCIHLYCRLLANELNDMGLHMTDVLKPGHEIEWTEHSAKKELWDVIMKATTGKTSVTRLDRKEVSEIYEKLSRNLAVKLSVVVPFPSDEPPMI